MCLAAKDWAELDSLNSSDSKAECYQSLILWAMENLFPLRTMRKRSTDPPWINKAVTKLIEARKRVYKETGGRIEELHELKKKTNQLIDNRMLIYQESQKKALFSEDADRNF